MPVGILPTKKIVPHRIPHRSILLSFHYIFHSQQARIYFDLFLHMYKSSDLDTQKG